MSGFFPKPPGTPPEAGESPIKDVTDTPEDGMRNPSFVYMIYPIEPTESTFLSSAPDEIPVLPSPTPSEIRRALAEQGYSLAEIGRRTDYSWDYAAKVIRGERHCPKIARLVAEVLGVTPIWLWPDYQDSPYKRGPRPRRAHQGFAHVMEARHELKKNLKQWGVTITRLAQIVKRSRSTVSAVINRIATAAPTAWAVINALFDQRQWEKQFERFFPDYTPLGESINMRYLITLFDTGRQCPRPVFF
jgi:lambda repressor-like predicted transcriptional regulator